MARPTKLTPEMQARILEGLRLGGTHQLVCDYAGVDPATFYRWMNLGASGKAPYREFCQEVKRVTAEVGLLWVGIIQESAPKTWQAAAWLLERRFPEQYGRTIHDLRNYDVTSLTDEQLMLLAQGEPLERVLHK